MLRTLTCSILLRSQVHSLTTTKMPRTISSTTNLVDSLLLAQDWSHKLLALDDNTVEQNKQSVVKATQRCLPLLEEGPLAVPFICRYRTDVISPLTTKQIHVLCDLVEKHKALLKLRLKLLEVEKNSALLRRIQTSTEKVELEDLYAPYKPASKGSISDRIQRDDPALVHNIHQIWTGADAAFTIKVHSLQPRDKTVHLLGSLIAGDPRIIDAVIDALNRHCRISTKKNKAGGCSSEQQHKYVHYEDFSHSLTLLKDHQVLAIRRGIDQKAIKLSYDIDGDKMESLIQRTLLHQVLPRPISETWRREYAWRELCTEVIHDAWSRVLRRKATARAWAHKCKIAEERARQVFENNLRNALLAPPFTDSTYIFAMDPGFQAGIKCALLDPNGQVIRLVTVPFLGTYRERALQTLGKGLLEVQNLMPVGSDQKVVVALGNGHGTQESRALIQEAADTHDITIQIQLVNEAGASVWSVTEAANTEFPKHPPASIAAISIGRRLLNPLHELIKVPPKSLGLGMYQHDIPSKELDKKLLLTSVDAVATVGVDVNTCSSEILQKVPGLTSKLALLIVKARPFGYRTDLLKVAGLGAKTYENCAAFVRIEQGRELLDSTLVHPESYELARCILTHFQWSLSSSVVPKDLPLRKDWDTEWDNLLGIASDKFDISRERVLAVVENLLDSITAIDPRLKTPFANTQTNTKTTTAGSIARCSLLSPDVASSAAALRNVCPLRGIIGTIRNIADFGAFIDYGGHNDGLLHRSKLGPTKSLDDLLIGQEVGIDILSVDHMDKVSLSLTGLDLLPDVTRLPRSEVTSNRRNAWKGTSKRKTSALAHPAPASKRRKKS